MLEIPGKIVHLVKSKGEANSGLAVWADLDDFTEIILSKTLIDDHSASVVGAELERMAASFGLEPP